MKHITMLYVFGVGIGFISTETMQGYDIHHPDPMSFLSSRPSHTRPAVETVPEEDNTTKIQKYRMYHQHKEGKYIIKPEPYSLTSKKPDPELLGPQRTYRAGTPSETNATAQSTSKPAQMRMTHDACIAMIGQEKFDHYVAQYGGESGALKRCLILKRLQGN